MKKTLNIFLIVALLLSLALQGQSLYTCHSENTVHVIPSCCVEAENEDSCCSSEKKSEEITQLSDKCCSKVELDYSPNLNKNETEAEYLRSHYSDFLCFLSTQSSIANRQLKTSLISAYVDPPPNPSPRFILFCSYLC